jgi:hypothetical protein
MFDRLKAVLTGTFLAGVILGSLLGPVPVMAQTRAATLVPTNPKFATVKVTGKITTYNNLTTTGNGVPSILQSGRGVAITSSLDPSRCSFTPAVDGTFVVYDYILVTAAGAATNMNGTITLKTEDGTARSVAVVWQLAAGGTVTNVTTATGTVGYYGVPIILRAQAATAITVSTTGTQSTAVYNHECSIQQVA